MNGDPEIEREAGEAFPVPRWARVTAFVGLYALALTGTMAMQQSIENLLAWLGMSFPVLESYGILTGLYIGIVGLVPLCLRPGAARRGVYLTAWSLASTLAAFAAGTACLIAMHAIWPGFAETLAGRIALLLVAAAILAIGAATALLAARRRARLARRSPGDPEGTGGFK